MKKRNLTEKYEFRDNIKLDIKVMEYSVLRKVDAYADSLPKDGYAREMGIKYVTENFGKDYVDSFCSRFDNK